MTKPPATPQDVIRHNNAAVMKMIRALANKHQPYKRKPGQG